MPQWFQEPKYRYAWFGSAAWDVSDVKCWNQRKTARNDYSNVQCILVHSERQRITRRFEMAVTHTICDAYEMCPLSPMTFFERRKMPSSRFSGAFVNSLPNARQSTWQKHLWDNNQHACIMVVERASYRGRDCRCCCAMGFGETQLVII